jgi:hypothetical protein
VLTDDDIPITEPVRRPRRRAQRSGRTPGSADSQLDDTVTENESPVSIWLLIWAYVLFLCIVTK